MAWHKINGKRVRTLNFVGTTGKVGGIEITENNIKQVLSQLEDKKELVLTMLGIKIEKYAKALCPVGTPESTKKKGYLGGTLRNSITFEVEGDDLQVGSNVEYAPYVELGTGPYFNTPPEWETFTTERGSGIGHGYVKPRPFLRPAIENHLSQFRRLIEKELSNN